MKTYMLIGNGRLLDIEVIYNGNKVFSGKTENAPDEIKKLKYNEVEVNENTVIYKVYSSEEEYQSLNNI